jgi:hypothetical protein
MMLVKGDQTTEEGILPDVELFSQMAKYNKELKDAGALIALDGLKPSKEGARVAFNGEEKNVIPGPFKNPEELVAGFWIIKADSLDDAITWAKRSPFKGGIIEIRPIQEMSDFPEEIQKAAGESII